MTRAAQPASAFAVDHTDQTSRAPQRQDQDALVAVDLFAGAGGLGEGLAAAGFDVAVAHELHPQAGLTYAFNHPNTRVVVGDVQRLSAGALEAAVVAAGRTRIDLIVGGPPCQGFSSAGKKVKTDPRNTRFRDFARLVQALQPRAFLFENVPGFARQYGGETARLVTSTFEDLGYMTTQKTVFAAEFGVPQRRKRFVLVGWRDRARRLEWPLPTHEDPSAVEIPQLFPSGRQAFVTVEDAIGDLAFLEPGWEAHRHAETTSSTFQLMMRGTNECLFNHLATRHRSKAVRMFSYIPEGGTINQVPPEYRSAKRTMARWNRHAISNAVLALPDDLIHYQHHRIPTVREMARLQTFPDDYVFIGKRTSGFEERRVDVPQYTQVGNAVPPVLAGALGAALCKLLDGEPVDRRDRTTRMNRHRLVRGSSGFAGYVLDPEAEAELGLFDVAGASIPLPLDASEPRVLDSETLVEWKKRPPPRKGQWAPGVTPRDRPSWQA